MTCELPVVERETSLPRLANDLSQSVELMQIVNCYPGMSLSSVLRFSASAAMSKAC